MLKNRKKHLNYLFERRWCGLLLMAIAAGYTCWYLSFSNPLKSEGALSIIGLSHPVLFALWGFFAECALYVNIEGAYRRTGYQNKWGRLLLNLAILSILITVFVPFDFQQMIQYIIHCYGAISFIVYNGVAMLILFFKFYRQKSFLIMACISTAILLITLLLFLIIGESGILETVPMLLCFLILCIVNTSGRFYPSKQSSQPQQQTEKELVTR